MAETYKIVRVFQRGSKRVIERGLTLEQAQAHCNDPETSWDTAKRAKARRRTVERGPWFDCYYAE
jgi:hypothetical protein